MNGAKKMCKKKNFKNRILSLITIFILIYRPVNAQWGEEWVRTYDGNYNGNDQSAAIAIDGDGNIYVTGMADYDYEYTPVTTVKYNNSGDFQWDAIYPPQQQTGNGESRGNSIAVYSSGGNTYIYVTGRIYTTNQGMNFLTMKYNTSGTRLWEVTFNGNGGDDIAR